MIGTSRKQSGLGYGIESGHHIGKPGETAGERSLDRLREILERLRELQDVCQIRNAAAQRTEERQRIHELRDCSRTTLRFIDEIGKVAEGVDNFLLQARANGDVNILGK